MYSTSLCPNMTNYGLHTDQNLVVLGSVAWDLSFWTRYGLPRSFTSWRGEEMCKSQALQMCTKQHIAVCHYILIQHNICTLIAPKHVRNKKCYGFWMVRKSGALVLQVINFMVSTTQTIKHTIPPPHTLGKAECLVCCLLNQSKEINALFQTKLKLRSLINISQMCKEKIGW